jgi:hypothetical protein
VTCLCLPLPRHHRRAPRFHLLLPRQRHRAPRFQLGPKAAAPPTSTANPTAAMLSNTPSATAGDAGGRPAPSRRPLWRSQRLFLGGGSGPAPSQKRCRLPSLRCCPALIRLSGRPRRRSCESGRHSRPSTSASVISVPSWRSAPRPRPTNSPWSSLSLSGSVRTTRRTSRRCLTGSGR